MSDRIKRLSFASLAPTPLNFFYLLTTLCIVISVAIVAYAKVSKTDDYHVAFLLVATSLLLLSFFHGRILFKHSVQVSKAVDSGLAKANGDLVQTIKKYLEPSIWTLLTHDAVIEHASNAMKRASQEETPGDKFVYIFGAAALSTPRHTKSEDDSTNSATTYRNALAELARTHTPVDRYINLFDESSFASRSETVQTAYIDWLNRQMALMKENVAYRLWHTIRASEWGSSRSTIVTRHHILDIVGDGLSGFYITGRDVADLVAQQTIAHIQAAKLNPPTLMSQDNLAKHRDKLLELYKSKPRPAPRRSRN